MVVVVVQVLYFYNETRNYDNVRVAPRTLVKALLNVSSTGCNSEQQSFAKLSYSTIDVLTNLQSDQFAGLLSGAQCLECDDDGTQAVAVLPRWNSLLGLSLGYSVTTFLVPQILAHEDALVNGRVFIFTSTTSAITLHRILITEEYKKCTFIFCLLITGCAVAPALC